MSPPTAASLGVRACGHQGEVAAVGSSSVNAAAPDTPAALRVGIFGGAFDPPHHAHVALAHAAVQQLALDELRIFPTGHAWHKARALSAATHRLAMARLAFGPLPQAIIDDRELLRSGPTYTIDTVRQLRQERPHAALFMLLGADQAEALGRWREAKQLLKLVTLAVAERAREGQAGLDVAIAAHDHPWLPVALAPMQLSATAIRSTVAAGQSVDHLVPAAVARYISQNNLYANS